MVLTFMSEVCSSTVFLIVNVNKERLDLNYAPVELLRKMSSFNCSFVKVASNGKNNNGIDKSAGLQNSENHFFHAFSRKSMDFINSEA